MRADLAGKVALVTGSSSGIGAEPRPASSHARGRAVAVNSSRRSRRVNPWLPSSPGPSTYRPTSSDPEQAQRLVDETVDSTAVSTSWSTTPGRRSSSPTPTSRPPPRRSGAGSSGST